MIEPQTPSSGRDDPYATHPVLSDLPADVRQLIADQIARDKPIGAIKTLRDAAGGHMGLKEAQDVIDGLQRPRNQGQTGGQTWSVKRASGKIDKGTTLTFYSDG